MTSQPARLIVEVVAGVIPEEPEPEFSRRYVLTSDQWNAEGVDQGQLLAELNGKAAGLRRVADAPAGPAELGPHRLVVAMNEYAKNGQWIEAGLLLRGQLRRELTKAGIRFTETKGLLDSVFVIEEPPEVWDRVRRILRRSQAAAR